MSHVHDRRTPSARLPLLILCAFAAAGAGCDARTRASRDSAPTPQAGPPYSAGAGQPGTPPLPDVAYMQKVEARGGMSGAAALAPAPPAPTSAGAGTMAPVQIERKVIRNGTVRLEVAHTDKAVDAIKSLVTSFGGYLAGEQRDQERIGGRQAVLTCRVPAQRLDELLAKLRELGTQEAVNLNAEDVTEQYLDLAVRLKTQQQLEERLRGLLERPSNKLSDLLEIEQELARVRGEIDSMEGRKRYWDNQVAFSTLTVQAHEPRPIVAAEDGGAWATLKQSFGEAADNFVRTIAGLIAAIGVVVPLGVALAAAFWASRLLCRAVRKRHGA